MQLRFGAIILSAAFLISGCYLPIKGRVIDAETQQPIEGALVLVEWTKKHGFGDAWTESFKVVEAVSDKDGKVEIEGCNSPFVERPDVTVYKKGYVAWNDEKIFPFYERRTDFRWGDYVFRLERFKTEYSHIDHTSFIDFSINVSLGSNGKKNIVKEIRWEELEASKERTKRETK